MNQLQHEKSPYLLQHANNPFTADYPCPDAGERYYLCQNRACARPVESIEELRPLLDSPPAAKKN